MTEKEDSKKNNYTRKKNRMIEKERMKEQLN